MVHIAQKPRFSVQMESGVLYFVAPEMRTVRDMIFEARASHLSQNRIPEASTYRVRACCEVLSAGSDAAMERQGMEKTV